MTFDEILELVQGYFACHELGTHALKGVATPSRYIGSWERAGRKVGWTSPAPEDSPPFVGSQGAAGGVSVK